MDYFQILFKIQIDYLVVFEQVLGVRDLLTPSLVRKKKDNSGLSLMSAIEQRKHTCANRRDV